MANRTHPSTVMMMMVVMMSILTSTISASCCFLFISSSPFHLPSPCLPYAHYTLIVISHYTLIPSYKRYIKSLVLHNTLPEVAHSIAHRSVIFVSLLCYYA